MNFEERESPRYDRWLFGALLLIAVWIPIPFGSNRAWAWSLMELLIFGLLAAWLVVYARAPHDLPAAVKTARLPLLALAVWLVYQLVQAAPVPLALLRAISPATHELFSYTMEGNVAQYGSLSVDPGSTLVEFLKAASYVSLFFLVTVLVNTPDRLRTFVAVLVYVGVGEVLLGIFSAMTGYSFIPALLQDGHWTVLRGTFVNRNHFAAHLAMVIPLGLGLMLAGRRRSAPDDGIASRAYRFMQFVLDKRGILLACIVILIAGLVLSQSRAGNGALLIALLTTIAYAAACGRLRISPSTALLMAIGLATTAVLFVGGTNLAKRMDITEWSKDERILQWQESAKIVADYPMFGAGTGTYQNIFPLYRSVPLRPLLYDHAHNDYLELVSEQGLVGLVLLGVALAGVLYKVAARYRNRHDSLMRGVLFGSLTGIVAALIHATVEFNFHVPANAAYFYALLGIGMAAAGMKHVGDPGRRSGRR